jgi:hypothetical protein
MVKNPSQSDLVHAGAVPSSYVAEGSAFAKLSLLEGRVGHHRDASRLTPWQEFSLDAAVVEIEIHLVRGRAIAVWTSPQFFQIGDVEVADPPMKDLPIASQTFERLHRFRERVPTAPMQ